MLKAKKALAEGGQLTTSCAMWQALAPFVKGSFTVIDSSARNKKTYERYTFTPTLPTELYRGDYDIALAKIEENGPYKFQVEGLE